MHDLQLLLLHLKQPEYVHVLLNPWPVYGIASAFFTLAIAVIMKSRSAQMIALLLLTLLGPATFAVVQYGYKGYDRVYAMSNEDSQKWLNVHKERAAKGQYMFYLMALAAMAALVGHWKSYHAARSLTWLTLLLALVCFNLAGWISQAGGQVRHSEFREGPPGLR